MTLLLIFQDGNGAATASDSAAPVSSFVAAVHHRTGVTQPGVPGVSGRGLAMWGWLRGVRFG